MGDFMGEFTRNFPGGCTKFSKRNFSPGRNNHSKRHNKIKNPTPQNIQRAASEKSEKSKIPSGEIENFQNRKNCPLHRKSKKSARFYLVQIKGVTPAPANAPQGQGKPTTATKTPPQITLSLTRGPLKSNQFLNIPEFRKAQAI